MGMEINLLCDYPRAQRNIAARLDAKTEEDRNIARKFGKEFFDGERKHGYGGFHYNPKYWQPVIPKFIEYYNLNSNSEILDVGCAKGFMLYDMLQCIPGSTVRGVDISEYAIHNCHPAIKPYVQIANATQLPFADHSFDLVISINTIHNLDEQELAIALQELQRVSRKHCFITVDAYSNDEERVRMYAWNLTAKTIKSVSQWRQFFKQVNYNGDYYWFIP